MIDLEIWTLGIGFSDLAIYCRFIRCGNRYFSPNGLDYFWRFLLAISTSIGTIESLMSLGRISYKLTTNRDGLDDGVLALDHFHLVCLVTVLLLHVLVQLYNHGNSP